jgi:hypothetical protein
MAFIDVPGFIADLKGFAIDEGFHVHDERHFVETYSLRQWWEVDIHPEAGCGSQMDLHISLDVDPRILLAFEDAASTASELSEIPDDFFFPLTLTWSSPLPMPEAQLRKLGAQVRKMTSLTIELAATDSYSVVGEALERRATITARHGMSLRSIAEGTEHVERVLAEAHEISLYLLQFLG